MQTASTTPENELGEGIFDRSGRWRPFLVRLRGATFRGRRRLVGWFGRKIRWEFWPAYLFYLPVLLYVLYLGLKFKSVSLFTAANPAIVAGGFLGESKYRILKTLSGAGNYIPQTSLISDREPADRVHGALAFMKSNQVSFPVVLKPDVGQRGSGVAVVRSDKELRTYLHNSHYETIVQEYVPGFEFGVFYYRYPNEKHGRIFSITEKRLPVLTGDGRTTIGDLILADHRAVCMARFYRSKNAHQLDRIPGKNESVQLVELGTHCRGAMFLDGNHAITPALEETIERISRTFDGFYFGRFDIRVPSLADLKSGRNVKVVELNGVSSEATHIYDPNLSLLWAYRVLFQQWRIAFEIGDANRRRGEQPASLRELCQLVTAYWQVSKQHLS